MTPPGFLFDLLLQLIPGCARGPTHEIQACAERLRDASVVREKRRPCPAWSTCYSSPIHRFSTADEHPAQEPMVPGQRRPNAVVEGRQSLSAVNSAAFRAGT